MTSASSRISLTLNSYVFFFFLLFKQESELHSATLFFGSLLERISLKYSLRAAKFVAFVITNTPTDYPKTLHEQKFLNRGFG